MHSKQRETNVVPIEAADGKGTCVSGRVQTLAAKELCNRCRRKNLYYHFLLVLVFHSFMLGVYFLVFH